MPRENVTQDLAHPHPGAVLNSFRTTEQDGAPIADYSSQTLGNSAQGGRWRNKNDQTCASAVAKLGGDADGLGEPESRHVIAVLACFLNPLGSCGIVAPKRNLPSVFPPQPRQSCPPTASPSHYFLPN